MFESWNKRRQRRSGDFGAWAPSRSWIENARRAPASPGVAQRDGANPQQALAVPAEAALKPKDEADE